MVKKIIETTIKQNNLINANQHIVIGLSGGPDSVCLFSVLNELKDQINFTLHAVHVNHGFRPGAAEEDQAYVEALCKEKGVTCTCFAFDCNAIAGDEGLSSEEAGRKVRYQSFYKVAQSIIDSGVPQEDVKIAVAQNADDQAETVLLRLLRGTGTDGLAGMAYSRKEQNISVIRPLLDVWRKDIEAYCREHGLEPRTDHTNLEPIYTRNKVRLQLIPYLQENFNGNIMEALNRLSSIAGEDKDYLWQCADEAYSQLIVSAGVLKQQELASLHPAIKRRVIMKALQEAGLTQDVTAAHLEAAESILLQTGESKIVEFPNNYKMAVRYGEVAFYCDDVDRTENRHLNVIIEDLVSPAGEKASLGDSGIPPTAVNDTEVTGDTEKTSKGDRYARFDYEKILENHGNMPIKLRTRQKGDYLAINGGRKKIQDLFVDMKIPKEHRDHVLLAAIGSEILWLPQQPEKGVIKSRYNIKYKLDMDTKKALSLEFVCDL